MSSAHRISSEEAALHNNHLSSKTPAILLDLDWTPDESDGEQTKAVQYSYSRSLYTNYINLIAFMGLAAYISIPSEPVGSYTANIVGVVFAGGRDMHPRFYHETVNGTNISPVSELRYPFALKEYHWAKGKVPILGICWGSQFLIVARGGSLVQDLPEEKRHLKKIVPLTINDKNSWIYNAIGATKLLSNCNHHQGYNTIPSAYRVTAVDHEGSPHAFESKEGMLELGFLGHPERFLEDVNMRKIAVKFGDLCKKTAQSKEALIDGDRNSGNGTSDQDDPQDLGNESDYGDDEDEAK